MAELRQSIPPRSGFADGSPAPPGESASPRHPVARSRVSTARVLLAPLAAVGAVLGGLVFVVLLPVCGIASLAEGFARACWRAARAARSAPRLPRRGAMSHH